MINEIFFLLILLLLSAFFSSMEIAFVVSNKFKIEVKTRSGNLSAKIITHYIKNPSEFFSTILVGNNIFNIAFASLFTVLLLKLYSFNEFEILLISTAIVLLFGELTPKLIGTEASDTLVLLFAIPLRLINLILLPIVKVTSSISSFLTNTRNIRDQNYSRLFQVEDIQQLVKESVDAGKVNEEESKAIEKILDLREKRVYEVMRPRTEIVGIEYNSSIDEILNQFIESGFSKIPVYEENLDNIKGYILAYDLFKNPQDIKLILREILFVPETKKCLELLNEFLEKGISIAIVIDEFGGTAGLITLEDLMEELFGEIKDEYDVEENICRRIDKNNYIISGKVELDYLNEKYNLNFPTGDYETIAGFIISHISRIPNVGENIKINNHNFYVVRGDQRKIDLVKLTVLSYNDTKI